MNVVNQLPGAGIFSAVFAAWLLLAGGMPAFAGEARVAVAANFSDAARAIGELFEKQTGHSVSFSIGSTGILYAQIAQGAPFDVFLAADRARPEMAVGEGLAVAGTKFTYAVGRLVLYSRDPDFVRGVDALRNPAIERLAIANPRTAPYGAAAVETLQSLGLYNVFSNKIVQGANIAQTHQFVATGAAELGFVALAQVVRRSGGSRWLVPMELHSAIAQDAVLLEKGRGDQAAMDFLAFFKSPAARATIEAYGYALPKGQ